MVLTFTMSQPNTFPLCRWCIGTGGPPILPKIISSERGRFGVRESIFGRACAWPVQPCTNTFPLCRWCIGTGGPPIILKIISLERGRFGVRESIFGCACAWPVQPCTGKRVQNGEMGFPCAQREGGRKWKSESAKVCVWGVFMVTEKMMTNK